MTANVERLDRSRLAELRRRALAFWRLPGVPYLAVLLAAVVVFLASWPIFAGDTDLWFQLNAGRTIVETGSIPRFAVGTFLQRPWIDYAWLFQLTALGAYSAGGYVGLIALRACLFLAMAAAVIALMRPWRRPGMPWRMAAGVLVLLVQLPRFGSVRPQLVALVLLAVVLLALERGGRWLAVLPPAALVWVNAHGVSWPVLAVALGACGADLAWQWLRGRAPADLRARALAIGAASAAVLVTPHGFALLPLPFTPAEFASRMIDEMTPLPAIAYAQLGLEGLIVGRQTLFNLVMLLAVVALVEGAARRRLRVAHVLLIAGGVFGLTRGSRFVCEVALFALPLLSAWEPPVLVRERGMPRLIAVAALVFLALMPFATLVHLRYPGRWPFSVDNLPTGIAGFLARAGRGGTVFGSPDLAGYLEWKLAPRYRVFADVQTPFPYQDLDMFLAIGHTGDRVLLGRALERYRPDFLTIDVNDREAPGNLDPRWGYRPVAFDWTTVLYAHRRSQRELVERYELRAVDPFIAVAGQLRPGAPPELGRTELGRLLALDPDNGAAAVALARLELARGNAAGSLALAGGAAQLTPLRAETWMAVGDASLALGRSAEAVDAYETARRRGGNEDRIGRQLWVCWTKLGEPRRAYRELDRVVDPVGSATTYVDLLALGETAAAVGNREAAERNLSFALWKAPDAESQLRAAAALARVRRR
jgi:hypothetical protein